MNERTIRKFNPGVFQSDAEVMRQFVVRRNELDIVTDVLRDNLGSGSCQHILVVGPRGRGKTMLLARVAAELRTNDEFSGQMLPVRFTEESHEIFNAADLWLETLFHLGRECKSLDSDLASELRKTHAGLLRQWNEKATEGRALAAVLEASGRLGKKLVLMIENLQSLSDAVDEEFGWKLRGALQTEPQIVLVGTATSHFKGLDDARQPFFEMFRMIDLQPLSTRECQVLWRELSDDDATERDIRPLQILTGGSPRLLVIVAQFARHRSMGQLMEELVALVDEHTEYFRSHLERLSKAERRAYLAVIDLWHPAKAGEIANRAQMEIRVVSTMLKRLVDRGIVLVEGSERSRRYSASERLYGIYYKLRREQDDSVIVQNLIQFMIAFYSESELLGHCLSLMERANTSIESQRYLELFIRQIAGVNLDFAGLIGVVSSDVTVGRTRLKQASNASTLPKDGISACDQVIRKFENYKIREIGELMTSAACALKVVLNFKLNNLQEANLVGELLVKRCAQSDIQEVRLVVANSLRFRAHWNAASRDFREVIAVCESIDNHFRAADECELQCIVMDALEHKSDAHSQLGEYVLALRVCDEIIMRFGSSQNPQHRARMAWAYFCKTSIFAKSGDSEMMVTACDDAITVFEGRDGSFFSGLRAILVLKRSTDGISLNEGAAVLSHFTSAVPQLTEALDHSDDWPTPRFRFMIALMLSLKLSLLRCRTSDRSTTIRSEEILSTCAELDRNLDTVSPTQRSRFAWQVVSARSRALLAQQKPDEAMRAFGFAYKIFVHSTEPMLDEMIALVIDLVSDGASEVELLEILRTDDEKSDALAPLVVALGERAGEMFSVPVEIREVAEDIGNLIGNSVYRPSRLSTRSSRNS